MAMIAGSNEQLNANQIAERLGFSRNHLAKVLQLLAKHNYLESSRGPKGGFKLKANPKDINILEIYELVEGRLDENKCIHNLKNCPFNECVFGNFGPKLTQQFKDYFGNRKLSDIIIKPKRKTKVK